MKQRRKSISILMVLLLLAVLFLHVTALAGTANIGGQSYSLADYTDLAEQPENTDFSFLFLGDVQFDQDMELEHAAWGDLILAAVENNPSLAFTIQIGDLINNNNQAQWQSVFTQAQKVFDTLPLLVVAGNHESSNVDTYKPEQMLEYFTLPQNGPEGFVGEFYSFDYADCHFVGLNSNIYEQLENNKITQKDFERVNEWIRSDLQNSSKTWKIVFMHHPAYSVVNDKTANQIMQSWVPIFEEALVDIVLCGHQHTYMRTFPMLNGVQDDAKGITYLMGNSGGKHYNEVAQIYADKMFSGISTYTVFQFKGDKLTLKTYDIDNNELDSFTAYARDRSGNQLAGDVNGDGVVNMRDVNAIISAVLYREFHTNMDINKDGAVNILDVHALALQIS